MKFRVTALLAAALLCPPPVGALAALPDEIEVFDDTLAHAGRAQATVHLNASPRGRATPDFAGEITPDRTLRAMLELAYGLRRDLEIGLHVPFIYESGGKVEAAGLRPRLRWVPLKPEGGGEGGFLGFNLEYSSVRRDLERPARHMEWKPIAGWRGERWLASANPSFVAWLSDGPKPRPEFALNGMLKYRLNATDLAGIELYSSYGPLGDFRPRSERDQWLFLAGDFTTASGHRVNVGLGRGLTAHGDRLMVKLVIGFP
jgi:hypothetical protein